MFDMGDAPKPELLSLQGKMISCQRHVGGHNQALVGGVIIIDCDVVGPSTKQAWNFLPAIFHFAVTSEPYGSPHLAVKLDDLCMIKVLGVYTPDSHRPVDINGLSTNILDLKDKWITFQLRYMLDGPQVKNYSIGVTHVQVINNQFQVLGVEIDTSARHLGPYAFGCESAYIYDQMSRIETIDKFPFPFPPTFPIEHKAGFINFTGEQAPPYDRRACGGTVCDRTPGKQKRHARNQLPGIIRIMRHRQ